MNFEDRQTIKAYYSRPIKTMHQEGNVIIIDFEDGGWEAINEQEIDNMADTMLWHEYYRNLHKCKMISYE